jgi:phytoene dehydrogenase-like protein
MTSQLRCSSPPKVVIIGAGIAGLCAGVYARKSGFDVEIVEMSGSSGGLATNWQRGDYTFETCLQWLLGSNPTSPFHALWKEVFDIDALTFIDREEVLRLETDDGQSVALFTDVDRTERELLRIAPEDRVQIQRLARGIRKLAGFEMPVAADTTIQLAQQLLRAIPYLSELRVWSHVTLGQLGARFQNPLVRQLVSGGAISDASAAALVFSLAWASKRDAGYPIGGSQAVIRSIDQRFRSLGGRIRFRSRVERVLVHEGVAAGVRLAGGEEVIADWVISAADGHSTLFEWIPPEYRDPEAARQYERLKPFPSYLQVSLGVNRNLSQVAPHFTRGLAEPLTIDPGSVLRGVEFRVFNFDPTFAPTGKTAVTCFLPTYNYEYWLNLQKGDAAQYAAKKQAVGDAVIEILDRKVPGLRRDIELVDVSTPVSVIRHTGNWKGSMEGFLPTPDAGFRKLRMTLPRLRHFVMVGQWVMPGGGLPSGLMTGRDGIRTLCRQSHRPFTPR